MESKSTQFLVSAGLADLSMQSKLQTKMIGTLLLPVQAMKRHRLLPAASAIESRTADFPMLSFTSKDCNTATLLLA